MQVQRSDFDKVMVPNYVPAGFIPVKGKGSRIWDQSEKEYIDFAAGIAVSCLGHCHPEVVKALTDQAQNIWHLSNTLTNEPALRLAAKLVEKTFAERVFFANSGAEANEAAFKLARKWAIDQWGPEKHEIIAFDNSFHGRTFFTVSVGGQAKYSDGFGPKPGGITHLPYNDIQTLEKTISARTCAVVIEPVQGEGGILPATKEFLKRARELCDQHNALLVFDEIQTGVGRTGSLYAYMQYGVTPDILTSSKAIAAGFPLAAMMTTSKIASHLAFGTHGSTFGGNPLGCAVGAKVIDIVSSEEVLKGVSTRADLFKQELEKMPDFARFFKQIRSMGLLIGLVLTDEYKGRSRDIIKAAETFGLMLLAAGPDVVRLAPSLIIPEEDIKEGVSRLAKTLASLPSAAKPA